MKGQNQARKQELNDGQTLWVQEIFPTIQGEGPFAGEPAVFIRLAGCNLRCWFCDTDFESSAWRPDLAQLQTRLDQAREKVKTNLIVLTGGEPLRQNILPLLELLIHRLHFRVQIETSGSLWVPGLETFRLEKDAPLTIVCSPKTGALNSELTPHVDAWKYLIRAGELDPDDGLPTLSTQNKGAAQKLFRPQGPGAAPVFVQPMDEDDPDKNKLNMEEAIRISMEHGYRLTLQLHKIAGIE